MKNKRKLKKPKVNLESCDWRQALDYSCVLMSAYFHTMKQCDVLSDPEINVAFDLVGEAMSNLYQVIGKKAFEADGDLANDYE